MTDSTPDLNEIKERTVEDITADAIEVMQRRVDQLNQHFKTDVKLKLLGSKAFFEYAYRVGNQNLRLQGEETVTREQALEEYADRYGFAQSLGITEEMTIYVDIDRYMHEVGHAPPLNRETIDHEYGHVVLGIGKSRKEIALRLKDGTEEILAHRAEAYLENKQSTWAKSLESFKEEMGAFE